MKHVHAFELPEVKLFRKALSIAANTDTSTNNVIAFSELADEVAKIIREWPQDGDFFTDYMTMIHGSKTWEEFSPEFRLLFDSADKERLDNICAKADDLEAYDHEKARESIIRALYTYNDPLYIRLANLIAKEADSFYDTGE